MEKVVFKAMDINTKIKDMSKFLLLGELDEQKKWSTDHERLLYLLSHYACCSTAVEVDEQWIRNLPLLVLIYEAIVAGILDYDYAPQSVIVSCSNGSSRRVWMNVSQDGKASIDDLREGGFINGLKMCTKDFLPITAFQVSKDGPSLISKMSSEDRELVDRFLYNVREGENVSDMKEVNGILEVSYEIEQAHFLVKNKSGMTRISGITDTEDVSYVSSPYLPTCLCNSTNKLSSNKDRAHESATGISDIKDELSVAVNLSEVRVMVGEWIPFGANQIVSLNERLGSLDRCKGGLYTAILDKNPTKTDFHIDPGLTNISIVDFNFVKYTNFEAEIHIPESDGIVQIESFGMHVSLEGYIMYGMNIEAILSEDSDHICVDHLSRLLVDVHLDSSKIMDDLLSPYQRSLLDTLYSGDACSRCKFNLVTAKSIDPLLPAIEYLDRAEKENELKQILGEIVNAYDLSDLDRMLIGRDGVLLIGPEAKHHEKLIVSYLSLLSREVFVRSYFRRTFILDDQITIARSQIASYQEDPRNMDEVRHAINQTSQHLIHMEQILDYLLESLFEFEVPTKEDTLAGQTLLEKLNLEQMHSDLTLRCKDLSKLMNGSRCKLKILQNQSTIISKKLLENTVLRIESNFRYLVDASAAQERSSSSIQIMQVIFSGSFAFDFIDRLDGDETLGYDGVDLGGQGQIHWINQYFRQTIIAIPGLWFILNMAWLTFFAQMIQRLMAFLQQQAIGAMSCRYILNKKISEQKLRAYLATKKIETQDAVYTHDSHVVRSSWIEKPDSEIWQAHEPPQVSIIFDESNEFLLSLTIQWNMNRNTLTAPEILSRVESCMARMGVYPNFAPEKYAIES